MNGQPNFRVGFWLGHTSLKFGGVGTYAWRILDSLLTNVERGWQFVLLCDNEAQESATRLAACTGGIAEVHLIPPPPTGVRLKLQRMLRTSVKVGSLCKINSPASVRWRYLERWLDHLKLDFVHFPMATPPFPEEHHPYAVPPLLNLRIPYIVTVHDVQELHFPSYFSPAQRAVRAMHHWETLDHARKVIVSYEHIKADLVKYFSLPGDAIHVCPIPFRSISLEEPTAAAALSYAEKYASRKPYLLYPSQTWKHKNHVRLLRALQRLRQQHQLHLGLICTGSQNEHYAEIVKEVEALELTTSVVFAGLVPEDELCWLYRNAELVTIPTEYEAGSFPLYEAMRQGAPVICSDVTSLPQTIGDRRFVFDPHNVEEMSDLIRRVVTNRALREENIANGRKQSEELMRINAAAYFYATYRSLVGIGDA